MMGRVEALYRYPVKGFSAEALGSVELQPGATIPFDRAYAVADVDSIAAARALRNV